MSIRNKIQEIFDQEMKRYDMDAFKASLHGMSRKERMAALDMKYVEVREVASEDIHVSADLPIVVEHGTDAVIEWFLERNNLNHIQAGMILASVETGGIVDGLIALEKILMYKNMLPGDEYSVTWE